MNGYERIIELRKKITDGERATVTIPADLFCDLVDASTWVVALYDDLAKGITLATCDDPDAVMYLTGEAKAIHARAIAYIGEPSQSELGEYVTIL